MKKSALFSGVAVVSLSALLAGCSGGLGGSQGAAPAVHRAPIHNGGTLVQTFPTSFGTNLIPFLDASLYTATAVGYEFDPILQFNQNGVLIGDLVSSWSFSPDKKTIYFHINPKARWSNGIYVTAKDVQLGVDWLASKTYNVTDQGEYGYLVQNIVGASKPLPDGTTPSGFKIINPREFSITMQQPDAAVLPSQLSGITPLPTFVLGRIPMSQWKSSSFNKLPTVGTGPFITTQVVPGQSITQKANPYYLFGKPHIAYNVFKVISPDVVVGDLASGQVDIASILPKDVAKLKAAPNLNIAITPNNGFEYLGWRLNNAQYGSVFSNVLFRQAVEYAINRGALIQAVDKGYGKPENGPLPPINHWYNPALNNAYPYSPAKANALLNQMGMKIKNGWRTMPNGQPFTPTLTISSGNSNLAIDANFIKQFLNAVHINLKVNPPINFNTILNYLNGDANGKQPIQGFLLGWSLGTDPDPRGLWRTTDQLNITTIDWVKGPGTKLNDQLIHDQHTAAAFSLPYRQKVLYQWQALVSKEMPENFLMMNDTLTAYNKNLHGVTFSPYGNLFPYKWYLSN